jgi:hypothetical protein
LIVDRVARSFALPNELVSVSVENVAVDGVTDPITTLFIVPATAEFATSLPVPVGLIVTLLSAGVKFVNPVVVRLVNFAGYGVLLPIIVLSIVLVVPLIVLVNDPVTFILG